MDVGTALGGTFIIRVSQKEHFREQFILKNEGQSEIKKKERRGAFNKGESKIHSELADIKKNAEWVVF